MPHYLTRTDLRHALSPAVLVQLTDDAGDGKLGAAHIETAITDAEAEVDGYLATHYPVPLRPVPSLVTKLVTDLAVYNLYRRRQRVPDSVRTAYEDARQTLRDLATRKLTLPDTPAAPVPAKTSVRASGPPRRFSRDRLRDLG